MTRLPTLLLLLFSLTLVAVAQSWQTYKAEDGSFSISMPLKPQTENKDGSVTLSAEVSKDLYYTAGYSPIPPEAAKDVQGTLANARKALLEGCRPVNERKITIGKSSGLEMQVMTPDGFTISDRVYVVGERLYQVMCVSKGDNPDLQAYWESFSVK